MSDSGRIPAGAFSTGGRIEILGTDLTVQHFDDAVEHLIRAVRERTSLRAHFCTVHTIVDARTDARLRAAFDSADMLAMDGTPLVWMAHRRGAASAERVCGPDVILALSDRGRAQGIRHFFLGGAAGIPEKLADALSLRFPGLLVAGTLSPPFGSFSVHEEEEMVAAVNAARPDVLWIGLGSPRQEIWAADLAARVDTPVILPVGAAFDFYSGRIRRAPRWIQAIGLEWLFRVAMDPHRLGWRYLRTNSLFIWLVAIDFVKRRGLLARR